MRVRAIWCAAAVFAAFAVACSAQQPGARPGRQGSSAAFAEFREKHKNTYELTDTVQKLSEMDKDKRYTLTQAQAKSILSVLKPLRSKPKLTQNEARLALAGVKKPLRQVQLNALSATRPSTRPGGRQGLAAGPRPGDGPTQYRPRPDGARQDNRQQPGASNRPNARTENRAFDPAAMQNFNPFYSKATSSEPRSAQRARRWDAFFNSLERKANPPKAGVAKPKLPSQPAKK